MIAYKHINKIITALMAVTVCLCMAAILFAGELADAMGGGKVNVEYETSLFDIDEPMTVNIIMDEADWEEMLDNATAETYYQCDVEINGETFYRVGIRPKGNTSLLTIASDPDTDRYSFKLEFDQYVDGQTCYGLDKLVLNNNYADATNMKEALIYDMYQYLGADASLYNYAEIYVNGEYWGVYLALEAVEDSFLLRNYGTENGELYKPDSMNIGGGGRESGSSGGFSMGGFSMGGFSMGGGGANLNYTDDDPDSYSTIWDGEVTDTTDSDHKRVITALKNISEGTDLEKYMDIDNLLRYMAVHVFSVNEDSLSGMMAHNYYLYESDGQLNILPWDYNLALGGMGGMGGGSGDTATSVVNEAIDQAFSGTEFFDTLMENNEYLELYHSYLRQLAEEYIAGGGFDAFYDRTRSQIDVLVENDPTAFYSYEEYNTAAETFYEIVKLRGESISGQVDGTIPSVANEQKDSDALIDASHLDPSVMGSMNMGDSLRDMGGGKTSSDNSSDDDSDDSLDDNSDEDSNEGSLAIQADTAAASSVNTIRVETAAFTDMGDFDPSQFGGGELPEDFDPSQFGGGELPEDFDPSQFGDGELPEDFDPSQSGDGEQSEENAQDGSEETEKTEEDTSEDSSSSGFPGGFGGGMDDMPDMGFSGSGSSVPGNVILYGVCFVVLIAAFVFVKLYRRRPRIK